MKLVFKDTSINYEFKKNDSNIGLKDKDFWVDTTITIHNTDKDIIFQKELITLNELEMLTKELDNFLKNVTSKNINFIKNYIEYDLKEDYTMEQKLYFEDDVNKFYSLIYNKNEIIEFNNLIKEFLSRNQ